jgi:hypothetical protein
VLFETLARHLDMRSIYAGEAAGESLALTSADLPAKELAHMAPANSASWICWRS